MFIKFSISILSFCAAGALYSLDILTPWSLLISLIGLGIAGYELYKLSHKKDAEEDKLEEELKELVNDQ